MGYRCPKCHADFGIDKDKFYKHLSENADCIKEAIELLGNRITQFHNLIEEKNEKEKT
jgi:hypothetical protein